MLEQNKVRTCVQRGTAYLLLHREHAVPLPGTPLQKALKARGPERFMIEIARNARAMLQVQTRACDATDAAHQELPDDMRTSLGHAALEICEGDVHPVCRVRITLTAAGYF